MMERDAGQRLHRCQNHEADRTSQHQANANAKTQHMAHHDMNSNKGEPSR